MFHAHPIRVQYGPPMELKGLKAADIVKKIDVTLRTMFHGLRERVRREENAR